jgi:hypothetical protein
MNEEYDILPKINRNDLLKAKKYRSVYLSLFITDDMRNNHRETMPKLNSSQQTYLTFYLIDGSMRYGGSHSDPANPAENWSIKGGFLQLMYDGYGEYVFEKPFAKRIKTWGAIKISEIVEKARSIYEKHKNRVEKIKTEKELSSLCSEITDFEMLDDEYRMVSSEETEKIKEYIENNTNEFATIDENNSQVSHVDISIKEMDDRMRMLEEYYIFSQYIDENISKFTINDENNTFVINASEIFGVNNNLIDSITKEINGKKITIEVKREK